MKFSIITPTFKRKDLLVRAIDSLLAQTYTDWEIIIVNDSPTDIHYKEFANSINDARIHYHVNTTNRGVNYSRNHALSKVSADSKWVIFLDDDDYLAPDALATFHDLILTNQNQKWFITNRAYTNGVPLTHFPKDNTLYSYAWSYLILKRCKGDATHCVETKLLIQNKIEFSHHVKQAEEWFFFYQIGLQEKIYYHNHNSTITDGYDQASGLNFRKRTREQQIEALTSLLYEAFNKKIMRPAFAIYLILRFLKTFIR